MPIEIVPHLWLGDSKDAEHLPPSTWLVVNCTNNLPFCGEGMTKVRIPVNDMDDPRDHAEMLRHWTDTDLFESILNHQLQGHDVLVHCQMGRQRSAATIAAYLMTGGKSVDEAIAHIKSKKRDAFFPSVNFMPSLLSFDNHLRTFT